MELQEPFPNMTDHPAWEAGKRQLASVGFSREQIASILSVKALYQRGIYNETTAEHKRQAFVRWLYLKGRLES